MTELTTYGIQQILTYPFKDPRWKSKLGLGMLLTLAGMFVPVIPSLIVIGYGYQILHRLVVERGDLYLPEWDDWGKYFKDGWRLFAVSFVYMLPAVVVGMIGVAAYAGMFVAMIAAGDTNDPAVMAPMFIAMAILFISMALSMLLIMAAALLLPPATAHAVAHGSFSAAFDFTGWWKILKANFGGFFLAIVIISGVMGIIYFVSYIFYTTIVLMCMMFILPLVFSFYMMLVGYPLYGLAYREGVDKLTAIDDTPVNNGTAAGTRASAEVPSQPVKEAPETPAKAPSKPRAKRPRARE